MTPEAFDQIEIGGIGGVPDRGETASMVCDERFYRPRVVNRAVVQE